MEKGSNNLTVVEATKQKIVQLIKDKYECSVKEFSQSETAKRLKLNTKNLQNYLSKGSTSLPTLNALCEHFKLPTIKKEVEVVRTVTYKLIENGKDEKQKRNKRKRNEVAH